MEGEIKRDEFDDNYPICRDTYATFRVFSEVLDVEQITERLEMAPTGSIPMGRRPWTSWTLTTKGSVASRDIRRHIDWLLDKLLPRRNEIMSLNAPGTVTDIFCYWESNSGQGGPSLFHRQMRDLGVLRIDIGWDIYFSDERLQAGLVDQNGPTLLIIGMMEGFESTGNRLLDHRDQQIMGNEVTLRLGQGEKEVGTLRKDTQPGLFIWQMTPEEASTVARQFLQLARSRGPMHLELLPGDNRTDVRILASSGEYDPSQTFPTADDINRIMSR